MDDRSTSADNKGSLQPYLSPLAVWALSVGSAIGWGSLVVTSRTYLSQAGPMGSVLGLLVGFLMMLMVSNHYHFLANRYPGTGGLYNYVKYIFGYDRAFLVGWFMFLTYISIFWANATSIPLFARYFLNNVFGVRYLYTIFGYEVYFGEALVTLAVILLVALLCIRSKRATAYTMVALVILFTVGITFCFAASMIGHSHTDLSMKPDFVPDSSVFRQVLRIAFISPWAFIGFESVSHSAAEYRFRHSNMFRVLVISVTVITALYIFIVLMSVTVYPEGCASWLDYIRNLDEYEGIEGLPAFYAAHYYLGDTGVYILMASLLALVISSLIGMMRALSRLCYAVAQDGILPEIFTRLNDKQIPANTIILILLISLPIPFLGRTAIGWIVDTTTFGATILYGFASVAVFKASGDEGCKKDRIISGICLPILGFFLAVLIFPNLIPLHTLETETYALMTGWSILGLVFFNGVIRKDHARNFGKAIIVWVALLAFIVTMSMAWTERVNEQRENVVIDDIHSYMEGEADSDMLAMGSDEFLGVQRERLHRADHISVFVIEGLFILALAVMLINYYSMRRWEQKATEERDQALMASLTDSMTGVRNKHAFALRESEIEAEIVEEQIRDFGIVVADVNGLKRINDTLGHKAGDEYICSASHMLCEYYKHSPVFRVGGDEFVVILQNQDFENRESILEGFNKEVEGNIGSDNVVISLGMTVYEPGVDQSFHEVFRRADDLMYKRKEQLKSMGAVTRD